MVCTVMSLCCQCNARGKCRNCACVKSKRPCSTCLPSCKGCRSNLKLLPAVPALQVSATVSNNAHIHTLPAVRAPDDAHVHSLPAVPATQVSAIASDEAHIRSLSAIRVSSTPVAHTLFHEPLRVSRTAIQSHRSKSCVTTYFSN